MNLNFKYFHRLREEKLCPPGKKSQLTMGFLAVGVGIIAGFGAVLFRAMIGFVHNLLFLGHFNLFYNANAHTPVSPWGFGVILVPVAGSVIVAWLVSNFAPEAKGHGVPEVMFAIYRKEGRIRPIVALVKSIASAISIGSGGSVGREGPIVQIGSTFGSMLGSWIRMPVIQRNILIAAGAASGIAATFNTPVGALAFAIELMLTTISASSLFAVITATVTATYIGRSFLGVTPSFYIPALTIPNFHLMPLSELAIFIPFGVLVGLCSVLFIKGLYWFEDVFEEIPGNYYTRHMLGMLLIGIIIYLMMRFTGHYYVQGVGYATIVDILKGILQNPWLLLILLLVKMLATFLTLGSGASGGIFSPSLFLGATLGGAFAAFINTLFPHMGMSTIVFAMAGMAGMVGGATGAVLTAITMVSEMTQSGSTVLPIMITVGAAYIVRKMISNESIYTLKLLRRGEVIPEGLQSAVAVAQKASYVMNKAFRLLSLQDLKMNRAGGTVYEEAQTPITIVYDDDRAVGILDSAVTQGKISPKFLDAHIDKHFIIVQARTSLPEVVRTMKEAGADYALVTSTVRKTNASDIIGLITKTEIFDSSQQAYCLL